MPTDEENVQYLYLVLTSGGLPSIDFTAVGKALELKPGAASKRWSRLKKAMTEGKTPGPSAYELLWLCVKHSSRDKVPDWNDIASKCNTTAGAASKRYSRMKQAFENGDVAPTAAKTKTEGETTTQAKPTGAAKRKRGAPASKKKDSTNLENGQEDEEQVLSNKKPAKRARASKKNTKVKKEEPEDTASLNEHAGITSVAPTEATTLIKHDPDAYDGQQAAAEDGGERVNGEGEGHEYYNAEEYAQGGEVGDAEGEQAQERVADWLNDI